MTTYAMLPNWTEQGILKAKDSQRRLHSAKPSKICAASSNRSN
jgi:uncharacterized protein with GYD domain